jgi:DNA-binding XRE family transcriptional regulator
LAVAFLLVPRTGRGGVFIVLNHHSDNVVLSVDPLVVESRRLVRRLAANVVASRRAAGLTQKQLAKTAELSRATVHLVEAGACDPRVSTIAQLARALNVTPTVLLGHA